jgi:hypothetical protein
MYYPIVKCAKSITLLVKIVDFAKSVMSARERVMNKCSQCESEQIYPVDTEDHECKCGAVYCGNCDAEFSKEGELLTYGKVMQ